LRLTDRVEAGFLVSAMGSVLFFYVTTRSVSVSGEASGIIYESEQWIGPSAELRIYHHPFGYNTTVVSLIVFFSLHNHT